MKKQSATPPNETLSEEISAIPVSRPYGRRYIHRLSAELRPGFVAQTNAFLRGNNYHYTPIDKSYSAHLKYGFQLNPNANESISSGLSVPSWEARLYGLPYQGIGVSINTFQNREELGNPWAAYLFQGARIATISPRVSFNYEWNLGLSWGWHPYDQNFNSYNYSIGSRINAYMNADFYLNWTVSRYTDLFAGVSLSHFSNGNTKLPNSGVNVIAAKVGATYFFNRDYDLYYPTPVTGLAYTRHMSYELLLFGSWRSKGLKEESGGILPYSIRTFGVAGISFASYYNLGPRVRVGAGLDAVYDGSANVVYRDDYSGYDDVQYIKPPLHEQMALGLSARIDYAMPFFTVSLGLGYDVVHIGSDLKAFYQILALKIDLTHNSYLHVGYRLKNFETPNFLMLGVGFRFNHRHW